MNSDKYTIKRTFKELELMVPSRKITLGKFAMVFQGCIYIFMIVIIVLVIIYGFKIDVSIIGGLFIALLIYLLQSCYETYHWLSKGKEVLNIDLTTGQIIYKKVAHKEIEIINANLKQFKGFRWCPENDEFLDNPSRYGMNGGRICFWIDEERYRMGISLTEESARNCIIELNDFLSNSSDPITN